MKSYLVEIHIKRLMDSNYTALILNTMIQTEYMNQSQVVVEEQVVLEK